MDEEQTTEKKPQTAEDIAKATNTIVHRRKFMETFRDQCKRFYDELQKSIDEYPKEIIANKEKPGQKLSDELTKKLREKYKGKAILLEYLYLPRSYYDQNVAHIVNACGRADWEDSSVPDDKELYLLADYVRLTILHDKCLKRYRDRLGIDLINNCIWPNTEQWVKDFWAWLLKEWKKPEIVADLDLSYENVKQDLESEALLRKDENNKPLKSDMKYKNQVPYNEKDTQYQSNKKALEKAQKVGHDHDIRELKKLNYGRLRKLLRRSNCTIKFMSRTEPRPRGRVNKNDWQLYLQSQIKETKRFQDAVEQETLNRIP